MPLVLSRNQLKGLCNEMGLFHGLLGRAATDSPGQGSDWLTINNAGLAKHLIIVFCHSMQWPSCSQLGGWGEAPLIGFAALRSYADHAVRLSW